MLLLMHSGFPLSHLKFKLCDRGTEPGTTASRSLNGDFSCYHYKNEKEWLSL